MRCCAHQSTKCLTGKIDIQIGFSRQMTSKEENRFDLKHSEEG